MKAVIVALVLGGWALAASAYAAPVTISMEGAIETLAPVLPPDALEIGETVHFEVTYDTNAVDLDSQDQFFSIVPLELNVSLPGLGLEFVEQVSSSRIRGINNFLNGDQIVLSGSFDFRAAGAPMVGGKSINGFTLTLSDQSATVLSDGGFGVLQDLSLSDFDTLSFILIVAENTPDITDRHITGSISSLTVSAVPIPGALALMAPALILLHRRRRRSS